MILGIVVASASLMALFAGAAVMMAKRADRLLISLAILSFGLSIVVVGFGSKILGLFLALVFLCSDLAIYFFARTSQLSTQSRITDRNKYFTSRVLALAYSIFIGAALIWGAWNLPIDSSEPIFGFGASENQSFFESEIWAHWFLFIALPALTIIGSTVAGFLLIRRGGKAE